MSSEERVVRPYVGLEGFESALRTFSIQFGQETIEPGERLGLGPQQFLTAPARVVVGRNASEVNEKRVELRGALENSGLDARDVELLLVASTPRLRLAEIVWQFPLDALDELPAYEEIAAPTKRPAPLQTPFGGCRLDLYLDLVRELAEAPLRPWRKGTWLAQVGFRIETQLGDIGFLPIPLTAEERQRLGLPSGTLRYAEVESPLDPSDAESDILFYVDEELLNRVALDPGSAAAQSFQRQLFLDAMSAIVLESSRRLQRDTPPIGDLDGSLLGRLLHLVVGSQRKRPENEYRAQREQLLAEVRDRPTMTIARIENSVSDLRKGFTDVLTGVPS